MAEKSTFIKLDRNITEWGWYHDGNTFRVFVHLILKANIKEHKFENIVVHRGELVTSRKQLAIQLSLSEQQIRTALEHLKSTGEIASTSYSKFTVISIKNYDLYQSINQQVTSNQPSNNQQVTSNQPQSKNDKNDKNDKNEINSSGDKSPEPPKNEKEVKHKYGEYKHVMLTDKQYQKLIADYGEYWIAQYIKKLDEYIQMKGAKYKDHNLTIRKWLGNANIQPNGGNENGGNQFNFGTTLSGKQ